MKEVIAMGTKEVERIRIFDRLHKREIKQKHAAKLLGLTVRQVRRLGKRYKKEGAAGVVHTLRGKESHRKIAKERIDGAIAVMREKYADFRPTFAHEKLSALHGVTFSRERLRQAMVKAGLWIAKDRKLVSLHQLRERRECLGELVQADGSPHDWFEGRAATCTLLVFIDDATGRLLHLEFVKSESTQAYFRAVEHYLKKHGRPMALYTDRHGVFRINTTKGKTADTTDSNGLTQFGRAIKELDIGCIFAASPEAKGRVEKVNQTLQDRLVKEMRLLGICSVEAGNAYVEEFMEGFNKKFAVVPKSPVDMHRPLLPTQNLDHIVCEKHTRMLSKQLSISFESTIYQIKTQRPTYAMRYAQVTVEKDIQGSIRIMYKGQSLAYTIIAQQPKAEIIDSKQLNAAVDRLSARIGIPIVMTEKPYHKPAADHLWGQYQQVVQ